MKRSQRAFSLPQYEPFCDYQEARTVPIIGSHRHANPPLMVVFCSLPEVSHR